MAKTLNAKRRQGYPRNHKSIIMTNLLAFYFLNWRCYNPKVSCSNYMSKSFLSVQIGFTLLRYLCTKITCQTLKKMYYAKGNVILSIYANRI